MFKIKGWEINDNQKITHNWINRFENSRRIKVMVTIDENYIGQPIVDIEKSYVGDVDLRKVFNNKKLAREFAIKYMKAHPRG